MIVSRGPNQYVYLQKILALLNLKFDTNRWQFPTEGNLRGGDDGASMLRWSAFKELQNVLGGKRLYKIRAEISQDLFPDAGRKGHMQELIEKINSMKFTARLEWFDGSPTVSMPWGLKGDGSQAHRNIHNPARSLIKGRKPIQMFGADHIVLLEAVPREGDLRMNMYSAIAQGIVSGATPKIQAMPLVLGSVDGSTEPREVL